MSLSAGRPVPLWRDEFAIDQADERYVTRRQFAKFLVLTSLGMVVGNVVDPRRARASAGAVVSRRDRRGSGGRAPVGGVKLFRYPGAARPLHPRAHRRGPVRRLQPEVHAPLLRGLSTRRQERPRVPVPRGLLRGRGRARPAGAAAAAAAAHRRSSGAATSLRGDGGRRPARSARRDPRDRRRIDPRPHRHRRRARADRRPARRPDVAAHRHARSLARRPSRGGRARGDRLGPPVRGCAGLVAFVRR